MFTRDAFLMHEVHMEQLINTTLFGKYKIISKLGAGSFGTVYLSKHLFLECYRAIKFIPKQQGMTDSLLKEAKLLKSLHHPGIPTIYDVEKDENYFYLIEEYINGESLEEFLLQQSHISQYTFVELSLQLCHIFQYLHSLKPSPILYLDLKPEHIIVCGMQIKLLDFNVATFLSNVGNIYNLLGNEEFSAPELVSGTTPNLLSDIYSIGKIMEYLSKYLDISLSPKFYKIIKKATHVDPACRFETVDKLISAINHQKELLHQPHLRKTIAIVGSHSGCGATHIAISLVSTLNYMGYDAVYYAKNKKDSLQHITSYLPSFKETNGMLYYKFFKGYPFYGPGIIVPSVNQQIAVYDYGDCFHPSKIEADIIFFICGNSLWHWHNAIEKGESLLIFKDNLHIICNMGQKRTMSFLSKQFSHPVFHYPYDENPFYVRDYHLNFVSSTLNIKRRKVSFFHLKNMFTLRK